VSVGTAGAAGTGVTFSPALTKSHVQGAPTANAAAPEVGRTGGIGGVPLVQPPPPGAAPGTVCGRVVVPISVNGVSYFSSSDCGLHWSATTQILPNMTATHGVPQMRTSLLPTSAIDGAGNIYVVWQTRSFRVGSVASTPNDIALTIMAGPTAAQPYPPFGAPARIPIEADNTTANTNDHFIPGIAADINTSGDTAHLALFYYNFPVAACTYLDPANPTNQCELRVGYVSSTDGGASWSDAQALSPGPTSVAVFPRTGPPGTTNNGNPDFGSVLAAVVVPAGHNAGDAVGLFPVGVEVNGLDVSTYAPKKTLEIGGAS